ncbi:long chain fatty acid-CoA synthetase Faa4p [Mycobacterium ahvazicum]|uniref:Long chain fatty acid-CoA synthetase Faa4p n=1 Tax=Mycobacterium ahvazicum TaxID=1964395 RepID=A0A2K4Y7S3_9MYCO|nr:long chain fatty acid-CoA synthetase [Mycobacterium ahvazicum]SOX52836.1 long chain fatty acid-CoA synthetase Faa4p [Mycobacterium ahvazicum]
MLIQPTLRRAQSPRSAARVTFPKVGQCFDIEITRDSDGWIVRVPEIAAVARASRRAAVDSVARECIAARTGIPVGYIIVYVSKETR